MKKVLCDTNVFILHFRNDAGTVAEMAKIGSENVLLPFVVGAMTVVYQIPLFTYNSKDFRYLPGIMLYER
jgi:predicted nucleic acid-binding protein